MPGIVNTHYQVIIVGGGIMGTSLLYHLTKEGWSDCLLLEKGELASGSTWHAAGQITHSTSSYGLATMTRYGTGLYASIEEETGQSVSWHNPGSLRLAYHPDEMDWLQYTVSVGRGVGNRMEIVDPDRIAELHPFYRLDGVLGALHTPDDGHLDPAGATQAFATGARARGATVKRSTRVTNTVALDGGGWRVDTDDESYTGQIVVNAAGTYARQVGSWVGLEIPIVPMTHHYVVTEEVAELKALEHELPVVRDDAIVSGYVRMERAAGLIGIYEKANPRSVWEDGTPWDADHHLFAPDYDRIAPWLEAAFERMPVLTDAGIQRAVHGAITHPPDGNMLLGPAPGLEDYWYCTGSQVGIAWGPGATRYLAEWMARGATSLNLRAFDPRRFGTFATPEYNRVKAHEDYLLRHEIPYPGLNRTDGRPSRTSAVHDRMSERGAIFEEVFGWERPRWFAPDGWERVDIHAFRRPGWYEPVAAEVEAVRERVGLADLTAFAKFDVSGPDSIAFLDRLITGRVPRVGRMGLTYLLTEAGMVEIEFTVARLASDHCYLVGAAVGEVRFGDWLRSRVSADEDVTISNVSNDYGVIAVAGPRSRELLTSCTDVSLDNDDFPWLTAQEVESGGVGVRALRVSFTGELGWELHVPMADMASLFDRLTEAGEPLGMSFFGSHALNAMRLEQGYKVSADMTNEVTAFEAGLMRFVRLDSEFLGREALEKNMQAPRWLLAYLELDSTAPADCLGGEAVFLGDRRVGVVTTGGYGFSVGASLAWAYVDPDVAEPGTTVDVWVLGEPVPATVRAEALWDPKHERARS